MQVRRLKRTITRDELKALRDKHDEIKDMEVFTMGMRLSVQHVRQREWDFLMSLEDA